MNTGAELVAVLQEHRLLSPMQLQTLAEDPARLQGSARELAGVLIQKEWLTAYQINQVLTGRVKELLLGPYVLLQRLGQGAMAQVYKARNRRIDRVVALKVIRQDHPSYDEVLKRFQREARAVARLSHSNIVMLYDFEEEGDKHFLVMEFVDGMDLARMVEKQGALPVDRACEYIRQAAWGLQHAHENGLIHRDIKPHNLLVTQRKVRGDASAEMSFHTSGPDSGAGGMTEVVKILDLGLARMEPTQSFGEVDALTRQGTFLGTPDYVAPEQILDASAADIRADVYSLGCTLYHLLTGQPPFANGTPVQKVIWHQYAEPPALESLRSNVPVELCEVVRKMMAKKPGERYQTPGEAALALAPFCRAIGTAPPPLPGAPSVTLPDPAQPGPAPVAIPLPGSTMNAPMATVIDQPIPSAEQEPSSPDGGAIEKRNWFSAAADSVANLVTGVLGAFRRPPSSHEDENRPSSSQGREPGQQ